MAVDTSRIMIKTFVKSVLKDAGKKHLNAVHVTL